MPKRLTIEYIKEQFEKEEYILLVNIYKNSRQKLNYVCFRGHKHSITWSDWNNGRRCPYCANRLVCKDNCLKTLYPELAKELHPTKNGNLIADEVLLGSNKKIWWICDKGHEWCTSPNNRSNHGTNCPYYVKNIKLDIEFIRSEFAKEDYKLLTTEYKNNKQKLDYICPEGHKHTITYANWATGYRCPTCAIINNSGKNHYNWKGGITCEPYCSVWLDKEFKKSILERDNYQCQNPDCWGTSKKLTGHHIDYNKKNCDPSNIITVCDSCNIRANYNRKYWQNFYTDIMIKRGLSNV